MSKTMLGRRAFLATTSAAGAIAVAVGSNLVIGRNAAWAMSTTALTADEATMLVKMARATYPHPKLDDAIYGKVIHDLDEKAAADPALLKTLQGGAAKLKDGKFDTLDPDAQEAALRQIQDSPEFQPGFQAVRGACVVGIYNNPEVWPIFGYEGESAAMGGYINRGFDDISWLKDA
jgi:hypothetical protein